MTQPASLPRDEAERLARLRALAILDTAPEAIFDSLVRVAATSCGVPIALVSLVDEHRQWFKANTGLPDTAQTARDVAFCAHAMLGEEVMEIQDATLDPRFAANPLVTGTPNIRFYAGAPLRLSDGTRLGALCVIDHKPGRLSEPQLAILKNLATAVAEGLEFRGRAIHAVATLAASEERHTRLFNTAPAMLHSTDATGLLTAVSDLWLQEMGYRRDEVIGRPIFAFLTEESSRHAQKHGQYELFKAGYYRNIAYQLVRKDGSHFDGLVSTTLERDAKGTPDHTTVLITNVNDLQGSYIGWEAAVTDVASESPSRYPAMA